MATTHSLHELLAKEIKVKSTAPVNLPRAKQIVFDATDDGLFGSEEVQVDFVLQKRIITNGYRRSQLLGLAEKAEDGRWITLYKDGQNIGTLLHEMAHQMPDGRGHGPGWIENFKKVISWYNDRY